MLSFLTNHQKPKTAATMQSNENNINDDDDRNLPPAAAAAGAGAKQEQDESLAGDDEDDDDAPRSRSGFWSHRQPIIVPTKTYDGGMNENERQQLQQQERQRQRQANDSNHRIGTLSTSTTTHDLFQTYSDTDTRMLSLLGLEPAANPNVDVGVGEQQEDWRQLTGFLGLGIRRDRGRRGSNQDAAESQAAAEGTEGTMPPRQTRISLELHVNAFTNMWTQRGELDLPNVLPDPPRGEPPQQRQRDTSSSSSSDQNGQDGDKAQGESH